MSRTIMVGLDGSSESRAAAEWAAREAKLRRLPVRLIHVWEPVPDPLAQAPLLGPETMQHWGEQLPRETAEGLRSRHPGVDVTTVHVEGRPADALVGAAEDADLLVLGSRGMSGVGGFMVGSVGQAVVARTDVPVVLVRAGEQATDEHGMDPAGVPSAATVSLMRVAVSTPGTRRSPSPGSRIRGGAWLMLKATDPSGDTRQPMASMAGWSSASTAMPPSTSATPKPPRSLPFSS